MKKFLITSTHRIGFVHASADEWELGPVTIRPGVPIGDYIEGVRSGLRDFERVIAYADSHYFFDLLELLKSNPDRLVLVSCQCNHEKRLEALTSAGLSPDRVRWVDECGGQNPLMELLKRINETGELPT